jgi:ubiquitin-activating enzyme E1
LITSSKVSGDLFLERLRKLSLEWATALADKLFRLSVEELLEQHPVDSVDDDGENFWSGTRSPPKALRYKSPEALDSSEDVIHQSLVNSHILEFVKTAARLRAETFLAESILSESEIKTASLFSDSDAASALTAHNELIGRRDPKGGIEKSKNVVSLVRQKLDGSYSADISLNAVEFEKDDESNGHVAFATAASNLRAISYGIPPVDAMVRFVTYILDKDGESFRALASRRLQYIILNFYSFSFDLIMHVFRRQGELQVALFPQ